MDSATFDQNLSKQMGQRMNPLEVPLVARATVNKIPPRLDKWLSAVGEDHVRMAPDPRLPTERNPLALMGLELAISAYSFAREKLLYFPASNYDATVYVDPRDGRITRVLFSLRSEASEGGAQEKGVP
jgi:hypothetical protein